MPSEKKHKPLTADFTLSPTLISLATHFKSHGYSLYAVGGCIRDMFMGKQIKDIDCTTDASPKQMMAICKRTFPTGIQHGTITILWPENNNKTSTFLSFEVTTHRAETKYTDFRHPDSVTFALSLHEDLKRRDLTINAIAFDPLTHYLYDPFGGKQDIEKKIIRCVGDANIRFAEDALRILRTIRFCARLDFVIEQKTYTALQKCANNIVHISQERISDELRKMLTSVYPAKAFTLLYNTTVYKYIFPEKITTHIQKNHNNISTVLVCIQDFFTDYNNPTNTSKNTALNICDDIKQILTYTALCIPMHRPLSSLPLHTHSLDVKNAFIRLKLRKKIIQAIYTLLTHIHIYPYKHVRYNKTLCHKRMCILIALLGMDFALLHVILHINMHSVLQTNIDILQNCYNVLCDLKEKKYIENTKDLHIDGTILCKIKNKTPGKWIADFQKSLMRFVVLYPQKNNKNDLIHYATKLQIRKSSKN